MTRELGGPNLSGMSKTIEHTIPPGYRAPTAAEVVDRLGGTAAVAALFMVQPPSVSGWRKEGIPPARMHFLRAVHPEVLVPVRISGGPDSARAAAAAGGCSESAAAG